MNHNLIFGRPNPRMNLEIMDAFQKLKDAGIALVMLTHEPKFASPAKRTLVMRDCRVRNHPSASRRARDARAARFPTEREATREAMLEAVSAAG